MAGRNDRESIAALGEDVPAGQAPVLSRAQFDEWAQPYLDSEPESRLREGAKGSVPCKHMEHASVCSSGESTVNEMSKQEIPGYNFGGADVARSPISLAELKELQATALFTDEDVVYLRLSLQVLQDQADDLVQMWRGIIALHPHLAGYSKDVRTGEVDLEYAQKVGKRFVQWVLDTARAQYDQDWLNYQYEIGLRHHRAKKNVTDGAHTTPHIRGRDLIAFAAATVAPMRPYLEKGGHSTEVVDRMQAAWWKSMVLQVTLWSQPYMNSGDF